MSPRRTIATGGRVLTQLRHDPRTLGLIFIVPCGLLVLVRYVFDDQTAIFNSIQPMMLGIFPLTIMFLVTSIATLRERTIGTLDRLMTTPLTKLDFVLGYALAFAFIAAVQATVAAWIVLGPQGVPIPGGALPMVLGAISGGILGTALGLFVSAFAKTEFQAVQFLPALIFPQLLTCGLIVARSHMATWLQKFSDFMPMTYSVDIMKRATTEATWSTNLTRDFIIVIAVALGLLVVGAITLHRRD